jgi:hypothetical protein
MKLYHGTAGRFLPKILKDGLTPRGKRRGHWQHTVMSNSEAVYLTDAYAPYFSINCATKKDTTAAIIEIDTDRLDPWQFVPDEDVLEQTSRPRRGVAVDDLPLDWSMEQRTAWYRDNLYEYADKQTWKKSLDAMGTCAYMGDIPVSAITRVLTFNMLDKRLSSLLLTFANPSITLMNYQLVGRKYRYYTALMFGETPRPEDFPKESPITEAQLRLIPGWEKLSDVQINQLRWEYPPTLHMDREAFKMIEVTP